MLHVGDHCFYIFILLWEMVFVYVVYVEQILRDDDDDTTCILDVKWINQLSYKRHSLF